MTSLARPAPLPSILFLPARRRSSSFTLNKSASSTDLLCPEPQHPTPPTCHLTAPFSSPCSWPRQQALWTGTKPSNPPKDGRRALSPTPRRKTSQSKPQENPSSSPTPPLLKKQATSKLLENSVTAPSRPSSSFPKDPTQASIFKAATRSKSSTATVKRKSPTATWEQSTTAGTTNISPIDIEC